MKTLVFALIAALAVTFSGCGKTTEIGENATRVYWIAAEIEEDWDYAPEGFAPYSSAKPVPLATAETNYPTYATNVALPGDPTAVRIGTKYRKLRFIEYKENWGGEKEVDEDLELFGPVIRAQEGDTIRIHFRKSPDFPDNITLNFLGVTEGVEQPDGTFIYEKFIDTAFVTPELDREANPAKAYMYQAADAGQREAGLIGPLVLYAKGLYGGGKTVAGIDKEYFTLFKVFNENDSPLLNSNITKYGKVSDAGQIAALKTNSDFQKSNLKFTINGHMFGNFNRLIIDESNNKTIRWYVFGGEYTGSAIIPNILPEGNYKILTGSAGYDQFPAPGSSSWINIKTGTIGKYLLYPNINTLYNNGMFGVLEIR